MIAHRLTSLARRFRKNRKGIAATEFALFTPMLMGAILLMADIGLAITEQIRLQQVVRAGAEFAMTGVTTTADLRDLMEAAATGLDSQDRDDVDMSGAPVVDAIQSCRCTSDGSEVSCTSTCDANSRPAYVFLDLSAEKTYDALFLEDMELRAEVRVQAR
jgi:Flp pilus assembly protein TadG